MSAGLRAGGLALLVVGVGTAVVGLSGPVPATPVVVEQVRAALVLPASRPGVAAGAPRPGAVPLAEVKAPPPPPPDPVAAGPSVVPAPSVVPQDPPAPQTGPPVHLNMPAPTPESMPNSHNLRDRPAAPPRPAPRPVRRQPQAPRHAPRDTPMQGSQPQTVIVRAPAQQQPSQPVADGQLVAVPAPGGGYHFVRVHRYPNGTMTFVPAS
jgi:hypothetical protein